MNPLLLYVAWAGIMKAMCPWIVLPTIPTTVSNTEARD